MVLCTARWRAKARRCAGAPATWPASCSTGATMPRCSRWSRSSPRRTRSLERIIASARVRNRSEVVPSEQLALILEELRTTVVGANEAESEQSAADKNLDAAAEKNGKRTETTKPPKQPAVRRPPPPGLRRVDNPIAVPDDERQCPKCGANRRCVDHETTEVIDLVPAEVIVRVDRREVLACERCDDARVQAPLGDKVVAGGAYGSRLVADLVVNKYWYGLPLNRQREMLTRLGLDMPVRPWATRSTGQPSFSSPFTDTSSARRSRRPCSTSTRPRCP